MQTPWASCWMTSAPQQHSGVMSIDCGGNDVPLLATALRERLRPAILVVAYNPFRAADRDVVWLSAETPGYSSSRHNAGEPGQHGVWNCPAAAASDDGDERRGSGRRQGGWWCGGSALAAARVAGSGCVLESQRRV